MAVHWLRLQTSNARGMGSTPGKETKIICLRTKNKIIKQIICVLYPKYEMNCSMICNYPPDLGKKKKKKLIISFCPLSSGRPCDGNRNLLGMFLVVYFFKKKNTSIIGSLSLYSLLALNMDLIYECMAAP